MILTHLDLCSGYGGFAIAAREEGFRTIGFADIDKYANKITAHRFPGVKNYGDIRNITSNRIISDSGCIPTVVTGGIPCQPHSYAGKRRGGGGDERDLWSEFYRIICDLRPGFAILENVAGFVTSNDGRFIERVLADIAAADYDCIGHTLSAAEIGASQIRTRVWLLLVKSVDQADTVRAQRAQREGKQCAIGGEPEHTNIDALSWPARCGLWPSRIGEDQHVWEPRRTLANTNGSDLRPKFECASEISTGSTGCRSDASQTESRLGGMSDGAADRLDADSKRNRRPRLKAIGNGIVPQCAQVFFRGIRKYLQK